MIKNISYLAYYDSISFCLLKWGKKYRFTCCIELHRCAKSHSKIPKSMSTQSDNNFTSGSKTYGEMLSHIVLIHTDSPDISLDISRYGGAAYH